MRILSIETSCDETAIAVVEAEGDERAARFRVLGNALLSQVETHRKYGGVYPLLAKREHAKNLVPLVEAALEEAELLREDRQEIAEDSRAKIAAILARESGLAEQFFEFIAEAEPPAVDVIAVTAGPGLEPALWVGVNFARALALLWNKPLVAVNHLEGHVLAALAKQLADGRLQIADIPMPMLALLISGGHTELVRMQKWLEYELVGETRDDAVGEAFDKVARMLGLPYPGGPAISALAEMARKDAKRTRNDAASTPRISASSPRVSARKPEPEFRFPRPMIDSGDCDFSFAGLKTAVLYFLKNNVGNDGIHKNVRSDIFVDGDEKTMDGDEKTTMRMKMRIAHEFENAVTDVLWKKTARALADSRARTLVIGGGVSANAHIRRVFAENIAREYPAKTVKDGSPDATRRDAFRAETVKDGSPDAVHGELMRNVSLYFPAARLATDNAVMIGIAGFYRARRKEFADIETLRANGNLALSPRERTHSGR